MIPTIRQSFPAFLFALVLCFPFLSMAASEESGTDTGQTVGSTIEDDEDYPEEEDEPDELERAGSSVEESNDDIEKSLKKATEKAEEPVEKKRGKKKYAKEIEIGKQAHRQIVSQFGIYRNKELQEYVEKVGRRVAKLSKRPDMEFTFTVLDDDMVNAMALPGGFIYVTRGILSHMNSEGELAAVLGHEIAHVTERHAARKQTRAQAMNVLTAIAAISTGQYNTVPQLGSLLNGPLMQGFSREFELEADQVGAQYLAKAGYSPEAMLKTIEVLKANEKLEYEQARTEKRDPRVYHGFLSSHPDNDKRYEQTIREAAKLNQEYSDFIEDDEFLDKLNGMLWGKSRQVGVIRKNMFYYPKLGIKLTFPLGWHSEPSRSGVVIVSSHWDAAMEITSRPVKFDVTPEQFIKEHLKLRLREGNNFSVADMPGYIGIADRATTPFGLKPIRFAVLFDNRRQQAYILSGSGKMDLRAISNDKAFIASIFSLAKMTSSDYKAAKKPKIQVVRADEDTTFASLAADSPIPNYAEQKLRVINGQYPDGEPEPGQLIKIVD